MNNSVAMDYCFLCFRGTQIVQTFDIELPFITNICQVPQAKIKDVLKYTMPFLDLTINTLRICWDCLQELSYSWVFRKSIHACEIYNTSVNNNCRICGSTLIKCYFVEHSKELKFYKSLCKYFNTGQKSLAFCANCYEKLLRCWKFTQMCFNSNQRIKEYQRYLNRAFRVNQNENTQWQSKNDTTKRSDIPIRSSVITNTPNMNVDLMALTRISTNNPYNTHQTVNVTQNNFTIEVRPPPPYEGYSYSVPLQTNNVPVSSTSNSKVPYNTCPPTSNGNSYINSRNVQPEKHSGILCANIQTTQAINSRNHDILNKSQPLTNATNMSYNSNISLNVDTNATKISYDYETEIEKLLNDAYKEINSSNYESRNLHLESENADILRNTREQPPNQSYQQNRSTHNLVNNLSLINNQLNGFKKKLTSHQPRLPRYSTMNNQEHSQQVRLPNLNKELRTGSGIMSNTENNQVNPNNILKNILNDNSQSICPTSNAFIASGDKINHQPHIRAMYPNNHTSARDYQQKQKESELIHQPNRIKNSENQSEFQPVHTNTVPHINSGITDVNHTSVVSNSPSTEKETRASRCLNAEEKLDLPETEDTYELILNDTSIEFQISENEEQDVKPKRPFEWNEFTYKILYETMVSFNLEFDKDGIPLDADWGNIYEKFQTSLEGYDGFIYIQGGWEKLIKKASDFLEGRNCSDMTNLLEKVVALTKITPVSYDINELCTVNLEHNWFPRSVKNEVNEDIEVGFRAIDHGDFIGIDIKNEIMEILGEKELEESLKTSPRLEIKKRDISSTEEDIFYPKTKDKFKAALPPEEDLDDDVIFIPN